MYNYRVLVWVRDESCITGRLIEEKSFIIQENSKSGALAEMEFLLQYLKIAHCSQIKEVKLIER
jgi:hypothetical protein